MQENIDHTIKNDKEEILELIFNALENIERIENLTHSTREEIEALKGAIAPSSLSDVEEIRQEQQRLAGIVANIANNDLADSPKIRSLHEGLERLESRFRRIEQGHAAIEDNDLKNVNDVLFQKSVLKREIGRWQTIMIGILAFLGLLSIYFFGFVFNKQTAGSAIVIYLIATFPFCAALYVINGNLKRLISQDKSLHKTLKN